MNDNEKKCKVAKTREISSQSNNKSKFFFDMLMALDEDVVKEYIAPHLPIYQDLEWLGMVMKETKEGCGLFKETNFVHNFLIPCSSSLSSDGAVINMHEYVEKIGKHYPEFIANPDDFSHLITNIYAHTGVGLSIEFNQCESCLNPRYVFLFFCKMHSPHW